MESHEAPGAERASTYTQACFPEASVAATRLYATDLTDTFSYSTFLISGAMPAGCTVAFWRPNNLLSLFVLDKGKPTARWGRKATELPFWGASRVTEGPFWVGPLRTKGVQMGYRNG